MSHDSLAAAGAADGPPLPATSGITIGVRLLVALCALLSIMQGFFVAGSSRAMHVWPAADSLKVPLPPFTP